MPAACLTATTYVLLALCEYLHHLYTLPDTSSGGKLTKEDFPQDIVYLGGSRDELLTKHHGAQMADTKVFTFAVDRPFGNITWYDIGVTLPIKHFYECENLCLCRGNYLYLEKIQGMHWNEGWGNIRTEKVHQFWNLIFVPARKRNITLFFCLKIPCFLHLILSLGVTIYSFCIKWSYVKLIQLRI